MVRRSVSVLCDRVGEAGGTERYWETVIPALTRIGVRVQLLARRVDAGHRFGVPAIEIPWAREDEPPSAAAASCVSDTLRAVGADVVVTAGVFDSAVLDTVRTAVPRWIARIHDHRECCPNGDRLYPQFAGICSTAMGHACAMNTLVHGCIRGPRAASLRRIDARSEVRDRIGGADLVLVSSEFMARTLARNGIARERIVVTPPALPEEAFRSPPRLRSAQPTLLFAGRFVPQKGLLSLVRALGHLPAPRPRLIVAGRGEPEGRAARDLAERLGIEVDWRGWLGADELRSAIEESWAVAVPSLWAEPFGLLGIEAQALGRPAVAYDVGGIGEWITGAGIAVPRADELALAGAIERVLDTAAWSNMAIVARANAERHRLVPHVARLLELFGFDAPRVRMRNIA